MHPNGHKYVEASRQVHEIWDCYTDLVDYISLDEGFLDVTHSASLFGGVEKIGREIKRRVRDETGLTCSVGIGYSLMSAKLASEEKKPDGFFQILTPEALRELIIDRSVRVIYGVGPKTETELHKIGIRTVRDIYDKRDAVVRLLGGHGEHIIDLAEGIDNRVIAAPSKSQSFGKETTFQQDTTDHEYLKDELRLIARELSYQMRVDGMFAKTITLKITYNNMKKITRSKTGDATNRASVIYNTAAALLDGIERRPIRLVGIMLSGFTGGDDKQVSLFDEPEKREKADKLDQVALKLQQRFGMGVLKTGSELGAEKRLYGDRGGE